jgi:hypothetical protein
MVKAPHLAEAYRIMVAKMAAGSMCREKCKKPEKPILVVDPGDTCPLMYHCAHLCHRLLPLRLHPQKGKHKVKHDFLYLPDCPVALMGRDLCKRRARVTFDFDGMAALKLRGPEAKILTLTVLQEEEWQLYASMKEIPEMSELPFKIPGVWAEDKLPELAWNILPAVEELKLGAIPVSQRQYYIPCKA